MRVCHRRAGIAGLLLLGIVVWLSCNGGEREGLTPIAAPCQELEELERFRYTYVHKIESPKPDGPVDETQLGAPPFAIAPTAETLSLQQIFEGSFVAPDRYFIELNTPSELDPEPLQLTFIGDVGWVRTKATDWLSTGVVNAFTPQKVCDAVLGGLDLTGLSAIPETLNGLETQHFEIEGANLEVAATLFGAQSDMGRLAKLYSVDAWLTDKGWPARLEAKSAATFPSGRQLFLEVSLEIKDVNAGDIQVESPEQ